MSHATLNYHSLGAEPFFPVPVIVASKSCCVCAKTIFALKDGPDGTTLSTDISFAISSTYRLTLRMGHTTLTSATIPYQSSPRNAVMPLDYQQKGQRGILPSCFVASISKKPVLYSDALAESLSIEASMGLLVVALLKGRHYLGRILVLQPGTLQFDWFNSPVSVRVGPIKRICIALANAYALALIHARGYMHGDVKDENIILLKRKSGSAPATVLIDYEFAKKIGEAKFVQGTCSGGTRRFMAPEIFSTYHYSQAADIYALGRVFLEMMCLDAHKLSVDHSSFQPHCIAEIKSTGFADSMAVALMRLIISMLDASADLRPTCAEVIATLQTIARLMAIPASDLPRAPDPPRPRTAELFLTEMSSVSGPGIAPSGRMG